MHNYGADFYKVPVLFMFGLLTNCRLSLPNLVYTRCEGVGTVLITVMHSGFDSLNKPESECVT